VLIANGLQYKCGGGRSAERGGWEEKVEVKEDRGESRG
jgi:hypothetical protein